MRIGFTHADFEKLEELWAKFYQPRYHVDADLIRQNTVDSPVFDWGASCLEVFDDQIEGFVAIKRSANPQLYRGPTYDQAHLSAIAFRDPEVGIDIMAHAKKVLRERGIDRLIFGQDSRHFFPGCPDECKFLYDFLTIEGFEAGGEAFDVERDLVDYAPPSNHRKALDEQGATVRPVAFKDRPALLQFLRTEFPGRWAYDTLAKIEAEGESRDVLGLFLGPTCHGFAVTQRPHHKVPIAGAVWRRDLGADWATLGPIGVSKAVRKRGLGDALLAASLLHLQAEGARRCLIDWTTLTDWYGKHGFEISRRYRTMALQLDIR